MDQNTFDKTLIDINKTKDNTDNTDKVKTELIKLSKLENYYENSKENITIMTSLCGWLLSNYLHSNNYPEMIKVLDVLNNIISIDNSLTHKDKRSIIRDIRQHRTRIVTANKEGINLDKDEDEEFMINTFTILAELAPKVLKGSGNAPLYSNKRKTPVYIERRHGKKRKTKKKIKNTKKKIHKKRKKKTKRKSI